MTGYIRGLDGLRALAILLVMFGHVSAASKWEATTTYHDVVDLIANAGWIGVQLFFVLSGFLITKILLQGKGQPNQLSNFYMRRSLRIFPVYYFTLILFFLILPNMGFELTWLKSETEHQAWYWLYQNNWIRSYVHSKGFSHLWSLAIEEQFYLVWPFVVLFLDKKWLLRVCLIMIVSAPIFRFWLFYYFQTDTPEVGPRSAYNFTFARWDAIALGALLAIMFHCENYFNWLKRNALKIMSVSLFFILIQIGVTRIFNPVGNGGSELFNQTTSSVFFFSLVFFVVVKNNSWFVSLLEFSFIRLIGKYSYAMYIFHLPIMIVWFSYFVPDYSGMSAASILIKVFYNYIIVFAISFVVSAFSWQFLELPLLKLKKHFA
jgi:peptidoglycan/LPS O-acetylase OafA/YrhL